MDQGTPGAMATVWVVRTKEVGTSLLGALGYQHGNPLVSKNAYPSADARPCGLSEGHPGPALRYGRKDTQERDTGRTPDRDDGKSRDYSERQTNAQPDQGNRLVSARHRRLLALAAILLCALMYPLPVATLRLQNAAKRSSDNPANMLIYYTNGQNTGKTLPLAQTPPRTNKDRLQETLQPDFNNSQQVYSFSKENSKPPDSNRTRMRLKPTPHLSLSSNRSVLSGPDDILTYHDLGTRHGQRSSDGLTKSSVKTGPRGTSEAQTYEGIARDVIMPGAR